MYTYIYTYICVYVSNVNNSMHTLYTILDCIE